MSKSTISEQNKLLLEYIQQSFNKDISYRIFDSMAPQLWNYKENSNEFQHALRATKRGDDYIFRVVRTYFNIMVQTKKIDRIITEAFEEINK